MESTRIKFRDRTRALIRAIAAQPKSVQMEFFGYQKVELLEERMGRILKRFEDTKVDYRIFDLLEKETNQVIGSCGFHNWIVDHDRAEIGYELHPAYRGQGYMREAMTQILPFAFSEMNLNRIEAFIAPENSKSIQLVEHFNFVKEGVVRGHYKVGAVYEDSILFSLLKTD